MGIFDRYRRTHDPHSELMGDASTTELEGYVGPGSLSGINEAAKITVTVENEPGEQTVEENEYKVTLAESISEMKLRTVEELLDDATDDIARGDDEHYGNEDSAEAIAHYTRAAAVGNRALALILLKQQNASTLE